MMAGRQVGNRNSTTRGHDGWVGWHVKVAVRHVCSGCSRSLSQIPLQFRLPLVDQGQELVSMLGGAEQKTGKVDENGINGGYGRGCCEDAGASFDQSVRFVTLLIADQIVAPAIVGVRDTDTVVISCRVNFQNVSQLITRGRRHDDGGVISR